MKKTKLNWTKKLPTVDGFYFWRFNSKVGLNCMESVVVQGGRSVGVYMWLSSVEYRGGQWYGPIPSKEPK